MKRHTLAVLTLVFAFLGIADAWYLAQSAITGSSLSCSIEGLDGCNIVAQSAYSHLFGVPLGVYGVFFYALVFILAAVALVHMRRPLALGLFALGITGLLASIAFIGIQVFLIQALCIYCLASAFLALLVFITTLLIYRHEGREPRDPVVLPWGADGAGMVS
jgi:uncharacterized membrane protein